MYTDPDSLRLNDIVRLNVLSTVSHRASLRGRVLGRVTVHAMRPGNTAATDHANNYRLFSEEDRTRYATYDSYEYIMLELDDGLQVYVGLPWIVPGSLYLEDSRRVNIVLKDFREPTHDRVRSILLENGYSIESTTDLN